ncbi:hypothetical protein KI387_022814, partial [Taxus chinensis]
MAMFTNFRWGWGWTAPRNSISQGGSLRGPPRGHSSRGFLRLACGIGLHAARLHANHSHVSASFQESYSFENDINAADECNKTGNALYKELGFLDNLQKTLLVPSFWLSNIFKKDHEKSLRKPGDGIDGSVRSSTGHPPSRRVCTNILLALNILLYAGQILSQGKITLWGAKINSLINDGQIWRLATSSFLHANTMHLLVNCYSLNSVGPIVEKLSGPKRFVAVYMASAITSATMSYYLSKSPSLGASGAIFGLVGSLAVFTFRHKNIMSGGWKSLSEIARNIALNMVLGLLSQGIDNWGH